MFLKLYPLGTIIFLDYGVFLTNVIIFLILSKFRIATKKWLSYLN